ncbi:MAG: oligoendopeptidase family [Bacteroidota bacterium]|nr:oligoendopeptidase family [Bacteroidota bacterium]
MLVEANHLDKDIPERKKRNFVSEDFVPSAWDLVEPYFNDLLNREINSVEELNKWLHDWSELDAVMGENSRWIYVRTTLDTSDEKAKGDLVNMYLNIYPKLSAFENLLKKKLIGNPFVEQLDKEIFFAYIRKTKKEIELFRPENIALFSEMNMKQSAFDEISGAQSIHYNGAELTLQQAMIYLKDTDRAKREEVFKLILERRLQDEQKLDELLSELIQLRHKVAVNAGFKNYLEYRFEELGRFDYSPEDCLQFHASVEEVVMPLVNQLFEKKKEQLGLDVLKPWDTEVDISGKGPLRPFTSTNDLIEKTITCFNKLDPYFGQRLEIMKRMNYLDLDSRMHKGTGGYNMTMPEIGVPFIFMNSANTEQDLITIVHEGGHAIHTFLSHNLELNSLKEVTSEVAEVASMGMELMSMEHWDIFYTNPEDLKRAKKNHLEYILSLLARTCLGDSFQFWLYSNPDHTIEERRLKWRELQGKFTPKAVDWCGQQKSFDTTYHRILHFYVVPFYYIEYAFAELGALALWRNFKQDSARAVNDYKKALSLGYTKPIPVFYETAGAKFDFSKPYVSSLIDFLKGELNKL